MSNTYTVLEHAKAEQVTDEMEHVQGGRLFPSLHNSKIKRVVWDGGSFPVHIGDWVIYCHGGMYAISNEEFQKGLEEETIIPNA